MTEASVLIKDVPQSDRPRERLMELGAKHLSNQELLAILLGSGLRNESVMSVAQRVLVHFEGLSLLRDATVEELTAIKGIGTAKAVVIIAALEIGKRMHNQRPGERYAVKSPDDAADYVMEEMRDLHQEHFVCVYATYIPKIANKKKRRLL